MARRPPRRPARPAKEEAPGPEEARGRGRRTSAFDFADAVRGGALLVGVPFFTWVLLSMMGYPPFGAQPDLPPEGIDPRGVREEKVELTVTELKARVDEYQRRFKENYPLFLRRAEKWGETDLIEKYRDIERARRILERLKNDLSRLLTRVGEAKDPQVKAEAPRIQQWIAEMDRHFADLDAMSPVVK